MTEVKEITVTELSLLIKNNADFQLIDVREESEYRIANLNAELIPMGNVLENTDKIARNKKVVIHCRSGKRSADIIRVLQEKFGYNNLYNLKGGILAWSDKIDSSIQKY